MRVLPPTVTQVHFGPGHADRSKSESESRSAGGRSNRARSTSLLRWVGRFEIGVSRTLGERLQASVCCPTRSTPQASSSTRPSRPGPAVAPSHDPGGPSRPQPTRKLRRHRRHCATPRYGRQAFPAQDRTLTKICRLDFGEDVRPVPRCTCGAWAGQLEVPRPIVDGGFGHGHRYHSLLAPCREGTQRGCLTQA